MAEEIKGSPATIGEVQAVISVLIDPYSEKILPIAAIGMFMMGLFTDNQFYCDSEFSKFTMRQGDHKPGEYLNYSQYFQKHF